ncbi:MAG: F0F1 ATP synthase subunit epsilon [Porphyromonadaceae bacterium]|nr:F0F1 ATP synthase subunit epsilon [Porphyromonadaceae bacterium]MCD8287848.1 F0F1 ATP synthase subunit epsilon [Porphyromonadaceae bacterium]
MTLEIISPTGTLFHGEVSRVTLPGTIGSFTVLQDHASLLSTLKAGEISYESDGAVKTVAAEGGFVDVNNNRVVVCLK